MTGFKLLTIKALLAIMVHTQLGAVFVYTCLEYKPTKNLK